MLIKKRDKNVLLSLFLTFFKIGAFTFGGGYAMIPIISHEIVEGKKWLSDNDILDIIAVSESTPGPIAINTATFVGYKIAGFWGAFFSTLAVVFPSFTIITLISYVLDKFSSILAVKYAFFGIRAAVIALLVRALWLMYQKCPKNLTSYFILTISFVLATFFDISIIFIIIICAVFGLIFSAPILRRNEK